MIVDPLKKSELIRNLQYLNIPDAAVYFEANGNYFEVSFCQILAGKILLSGKHSPDFEELAYKTWEESEEGKEWIKYQEFADRWKRNHKTPSLKEWREIQRVQGKAATAPQTIR